MSRWHIIRRSLLAVFLVLLPVLAAWICIGCGRYEISLADTVRILLAGPDSDTFPQVLRAVVFKVRLPRIILALFVGAGLSVAGTSFQSLFTNPLATPDTLGVASGASFGAALAMLMHGGLVVTQFVALLFGLLGCAITYAIGRHQGRSSVVMIVLAGMVIGALFQAFVSLVKYVADPQDQLPAITYWLMGSLAGASLHTLSLGLPFIVIGVLVILALRWRLNILSLSEDEARSMGVNISALRLVVIVASSMITASCVSMCGSVGWIGLLVPHAARMLVGSDNRSVVPVSISLGATFLLVIDTLARAASAAEVPISILTAVIGAPFFVILLKRTGGSWT